MDLLSNLDVAIPAVFFPVSRGESAPAAGLLSPCGERLIRHPPAEHRARI